MRALAIVTLLAGAFVTGSPVTAQHPPHPGQHGPAAGAGHVEAQRCLESFERVVADGRGFGMAFAADRNRYPGPLHVLQLKEALGLSAAQESRVRALEAAMLAESRPRSAALLAAERRLDNLFAGGRVTEADLIGLVAEIERRRGEVRLVHLRYHLKTRALLTEPQRLTYHERRWGSGAPGR
ncbi:MAG: hypothetical protein ACREK9_02950 [Candidatus Rokuibacteriota bacterium]